MKNRIPLPVCARHRDGWCATRRKTLRYSDSIPTLCGYYIIGTFGLEYRMPDCPECLARMEDPHVEGEEADQGIVPDSGALP